MWPSWFAGNVFLRDCYPGDLPPFPAGFMTNVLCELGHGGSSLGMKLVRHEPGWEVRDIAEIADMEELIAGEPDDGDMGPELHDEDGELGGSQDIDMVDSEMASMGLMDDARLEFGDADV
ncbi:uncharacterized protein N7515_000645 [Penicillium bovifimosum]|uniref:Uncharacterized protein n=1 Tax=Penicillium bovifimosum TaxID=126998 RepID=A0A9W9LBM8_9EURO|nr:uncharacterized protein N7515_000645 [Penicillium bovifimosum]KAJ5146081.1 hypothetical protein N7515_000645 [Penicillium bovifimosum]